MYGASQDKIRGAVVLREKCFPKFLLHMFCGSGIARYNVRNNNITLVGKNTLGKLPAHLHAHSLRLHWLYAPPIRLPPKPPAYTHIRTCRIRHVPPQTAQPPARCQTANEKIEISDCKAPLHHQRSELSRLVIWSSAFNLLSTIILPQTQPLPRFICGTFSAFYIAVIHSL